MTDELTNLGAALALPDDQRSWRLGVVSWVDLNVSPPVITVDEREMRWLGSTTLPQIGDTIVWVRAGSDPIAIGSLATQGITATFPLTTVRRTTNQNIANNTLTGIAHDTEDVDELSLHSGGTPGRFTIPTGWGGRYQLSATVTWDAGLAGTAGNAYLNFSGLVRRDLGSATSTAGANTPIASGTFVVDMAAGSYVFCEVLQVSGAALNVTAAMFQALYLGRSI